MLLLLVLLLCIPAQAGNLITAVALSNPLLDCLCVLPMMVVCVVIELFCVTAIQIINTIAV